MTAAAEAYVAGDLAGIQVILSLITSGDTLVTGETIIALRSPIISDAFSNLSGSAEILHKLIITSEGSVVLLGSASIIAKLVLEAFSTVFVTGDIALIQRLAISAAAAGIVSGDVNLNIQINYWQIKVRDPATGNWVRAYLKIKDRYDQPFVRRVAHGKMPAPYQYAWYHFR